MAGLKRQPTPRLVTASRRPVSIHKPFQLVASFHSTPRAQGAPIVPILVSFLKVSGSLEFVRTLGRIALTFVPVMSVKILKTRRVLRHAELNSANVSEEKKEILEKRIRGTKLLLRVLVLVPFLAFWATIAASLERTPLTGRWRLIILSPEEEEEIAAQLAGANWYGAVSDILTSQNDGQTPKIIPRTDWRYAWVHDTLRQLESVIPFLQDESKALDWLRTGPEDSPLPPPAEYPLRPRPRAAEDLRCFADMICSQKKRASAAPLLTGPPYSLLVVDKPDASNAFSYGFGPNGAGGIVVYSGFLDEVLAECLDDQPQIQETKEASWLSYLFGGVQPAVTTHPAPTHEQTSRLAILLAHEVSHLILSHHLESLSSTTIMLPGVISMLADIVRVFIFPITMIFGPFVNDAVAQLGKVGSIELGKCGEYCTSVKQEIEADVVSARILAYAGYDPREAVRFWENRQEGATECSARGASEGMNTLNLSGKTHPINTVRVDRLKHELVRWETERRAAVRRQISPPAPSSIVLAAA